MGLGTSPASNLSRKQFNTTKSDEVFVISAFFCRGIVSMSVTANANIYVIIYIVIYVIGRRMIVWTVGTDSRGFCSTKLLIENLW